MRGRQRLVKDFGAAEHVPGRSDDDGGAAGGVHRRGPAVPVQQPAAPPGPHRQPQPTQEPVWPAEPPADQQTTPGQGEQHPRRRQSQQPEGGQDEQDPARAGGVVATTTSTRQQRRSSHTMAIDTADMRTGAVTVLTGSSAHTLDRAGHHRLPTHRMGIPPGSWSVPLGRDRLVDGGVLVGDR